MIVDIHAELRIRASSYRIAVRSIPDGGFSELVLRVEVYREKLHHGEDACGVAEVISRIAIPWRRVPPRRNRGRSTAAGVPNDEGPGVPDGEIADRGEANHQCPRVQNDRTWRRWFRCYAARTDGPVCELSSGSLAFITHVHRSSTQ